nr:hypothetical protein [bacterium]
VVYRMSPPGKEGELPSVNPVNVEIGENVDKYIVVTSGDLKAGDMVVTRGKEQLYPSAHIMPTNLATPPGAGDAPGGGHSEGAKNTDGDAKAGADGDSKEEQPAPTAAEGEATQSSGGTR